MPSGEFQKLREDEVHIWCATLECSPNSLAGCFESLSEAEKERAGRFYFERDRSRYIIGRGTLRRLLGSYLELKPGDVEIDTLEYGKPFLKNVPKPLLQFNLAHSHNLAVYAFHRCYPLGIDVEFIHPMADEDSFAAMYFTQREIAWLAALSGADKTAGFFKLWTCKEAYLKAHGAGLIKPLNQVDVWLEDGEAPRLASLDDEDAGIARWELEMFAPAEGFQAALVVEGSGWRPVFLQEMQRGD